jgi:hypothetical protein
LVKTKIVDLDGKLPFFGKIVISRYLFLGLISQLPIIGLITALVDCLLIFGRERRCLHDYLAGTKVVNA